MILDDKTTYIISIAFAVILAFVYGIKTLGTDRKLYYYFKEDGEDEFDWDFLKKIIIQLVVVFFTSFTFLNIFYFVFNGSWISEENMQTSKSFILIGSVIYALDTMKSSMNLIREQKKKKKRK